MTYKVLLSFQAMKEEEALEMKANLETKGEVEFYVCTLGKNVSITKNMVAISKEKKKEHQRVFTPSVIEPSFGIGRIIYCLYEHSYYMRPSKAGDEQMNVFRFPPLVAPIKCTVFPLVQNEKYEKVAKEISKSLTVAGISHKIDITGLELSLTLSLSLSLSPCKLFYRGLYVCLLHERMHMLVFVLVEPLLMWFDLRLIALNRDINRQKICTDG